MKRLISILLLLAMLAGSAVSCSEKPAGEGPDAASETPTAENEPAAVPEEEETELSVLPVSYDASRSEYIVTLLKAMAFYTQKNIVPEYIETLVKTKYARDAESAEMFTIAFDGIYFDFGINAWQEQVAAKLLKGAFVGLAGNFGSVLQTMQKSVDAEIKRLIKQIDKAG